MIKLNTGWILMTYSLLIVNGYTVSNRNQDYSTGNQNGFIDTSGSSDLADQLTSSGSFASSSHRYSTISGGGGVHGNTVNSYSPTSYTDNTGQTNGFRSQSTSNSEALNTLPSTYSSDSHSSSDIIPNYSGTANSDTYTNNGNLGLIAYTTNSHSSNLPTSNTGDYSSSPLTSSYAAAAASSSPSLSTYTINSPKASPYTALANKQYIPASSYSSNPNLNYITNSHPNTYPHSSHSNSHPPSHLPISYSANRHTSSNYPSVNYHNNYHDGPKYPSQSSSLNNYLIHNTPQSNFIHTNGGPPKFILGAGSSSNFVKVPTSASSSSSAAALSPSSSPSFYPGPFSKTPSKFIIIKDGSGNGPGHFMQSAESPFPNNIFPPGLGYKVKAPGLYSSSPHISSSSINSHNFNGGSNPSYPIVPTNSRFSYH